MLLLYFYYILFRQVHFKEPYIVWWNNHHYHFYLSTWSTGRQSSYWMSFTRICLHSFQLLWVKFHLNSVWCFINVLWVLCAKNYEFFRVTYSKTFLKLKYWSVKCQIKSKILKMQKYRRFLDATKHITLFCCSLVMKI
jgi:hypothetical protein